MDKKYSKIIAAFVVAIVTLVTMGACNDDEEIIVGVNPTSHILISGTVVDESGAPVQNAEITFFQFVPEPTDSIIYQWAGQFVDGHICGPNWDMTSDPSPVLTDTSGYYILYASPMFDTLKIVCTPPEDSNLETQEKVIDIEYTQDDPDLAKYGYLGSYTGTVDFTLAPATTDSDE